MIEQETYTGPLPRPDILARYDEIVEGGAERIFVQFEEQARHRRGLEHLDLTWGIVRSFAGLVAGLVVVLAMVWASYELIMAGHDVAGSILGTGSLATLAAIFAYGSHLREDERIKKIEMLINRDRRR